MAVDLYIHVFEDGELTEDHFRALFSNTLGSKWCLPLGDPRQVYGHHWRKKARELANDALRTPSVWVGETSWAKGAFFEDYDAYVPAAVEAVDSIIGEDLPVIDNELIAKVGNAMTLPNNTVRDGGTYNGRGYSVASRDDVVEFLTQHIGKRAFTISR